MGKIERVVLNTERPAHTCLPLNVLLKKIRSC